MCSNSVSMLKENASDWLSYNKRDLYFVVYGKLSEYTIAMEVVEVRTAISTKEICE